MQASVHEILEFLTVLFHQGLGYSAINSARSAIVTVISTCTDAPELGSSVLLNKFMRGVFLSKPTFPKTSFTWDVERLLHFLNKWSPPKTLSLSQLTCKTASLLLILSGQRGQSIHSLLVSDVECNDTHVIVRYSGLLKTSRPGSHMPETVLPAYPEIGLCVVRTCAEYMKRTKSLRASDCKAFFLTCQRPHRRAARDTVSNWVKRTLRLAGIDLAIFTPHSTRSAAASAASETKLPLVTILRTAGWTRESTFRKFYHKEVRRDTSFADSLLMPHNEN